MWQWAKFWNPEDLNTFQTVTYKSLNYFYFLKTKFATLLFETQEHKLNSHVDWPHFREGDLGWKKEKRPRYPESKVPQDHHWMVVFSVEKAVESKWDSGFLAKTETNGQTWRSEAEWGQSLIVKRKMSQVQKKNRSECSIKRFSNQPIKNGIVSGFQARNS